MIKMSVYDIPNVTVEPIGGMFRLTANDGWCIHLPAHDELTYKKVVILRSTYDFSQVQVIPETDLPEGAEILADEKKGSDIS